MGYKRSDYDKLGPYIDILCGLEASQLQSLLQPMAQRAVTILTYLQTQKGWLTALEISQNVEIDPELVRGCLGSFRDCRIPSQKWQLQWRYRRDEHADPGPPSLEYLLTRIR